MDHLREAEKALKTSFLKWTPDWLSAAYSFDKAGETFKRQGETEKAIHAYVNAAQAHEKNKDENAAGKAYEQAAIILCEQCTKDSGDGSVFVKNVKRAQELFENASRRYVESVEWQRASKTNMIAGKSMEAFGMQNEGTENGNYAYSLAAVFYKRSCEYLIRSEKKAFGLEALGAALNFFVRTRQYKDALELCSSMIEVYSNLNQSKSKHRCYLTIVILHLLRNDVVAARLAFSDHFDDNDYLRSSECKCAEELLAAWESRNEEEVERVVKSTTVTGLERQVAGAARKLNPFKSTLPTTIQTVDPLKQVDTSTKPQTSHEQNLEEDPNRGTLFAKKAPSSIPPTPSQLDMTSVKQELENTAQSTGDRPASERQEQNQPASTQQDNPDPPVLNDQEEDDDDLDFLR